MDTAPLVAVDRASAELRRGGLVVITGSGRTLLVGAAEAADVALLDRVQTQSGSEGQLIITARRASVMGLDPQGALALAVSLPQPVEETLIAVLSDPAAAVNAQASPPTLPKACQTMPVVAGDPAEAAVLLTKLARLLPAAIVAPLAESIDPQAWAGQRGIALVQEADIRAYHQTAAHTLRPVGEARVPLEGAENARILAFRPADGGIEHLAIVIGTPDPSQPVLARLHSECFTGDLLGSLRCDCGDQLRGAILAISDAGAGVLLYLAQEGRGIGLVNKLRAYQLQDAGFDTLDANGQLGFDDDERIYQPAAEMLRQLGFGSVRLMTNNPLKVDALARHGVTVSERVPHVFQSNVHNLSYLRTKAIKGGHLF
jgi:GTP cyclohydrolase II